MKPARSTEWTDEEAAREAACWEERAREEAEWNKGFSRSGSCAGGIETYSAEWDVGHLRCLDERKAFFQGSWAVYDPVLIVPGTKVLVFWTEKPNSLRKVEFVLPWKEV